MALGWFKREPKHVKSEGVFQKCEGCGSTLVIKELEENLNVCKGCGFHFKVIDADERGQLRVIVSREE